MIIMFGGSGVSECDKFSIESLCIQQALSLPLFAQDEAASICHIVIYNHTIYYIR